MTKNRKEHRKRVRINGLKQKAERVKAIAHRKNLETLQKVLHHTDAMRISHPQLFESVTNVVNALAKESGSTPETVMREGVMLFDDNGETMRVSPQQLVEHLADAAAHGIKPNISVPLSTLDVTSSNVDWEPSSSKQIIDDMNSFLANERALMNDYLVPREATGVYLDELAKLPVGSAKAEVLQGKLTVKPGVREMTDAELDKAVDDGYQPAVTEWLRRHPDAEASDGGRLG